MSVIETKNKSIIYTLVKNHFGLTEDSLELFKFRLFFEPLISKEYKAILKSGNNLRSYYELNDEILEETDAGWKIFKSYFKLFTSENNITYSNFRNNSFPIDGQQLKAGKALAKYYLNPDFPNRFIFDFYNTMDIEVSKLIFFKEPTVLNEPIFIRSIVCSDTNADKIKIVYKANKDILKSKKIVVNVQEATIVFNDIKTAFSNFINENLDYIGTKKIPNRKLYLVFSLNFTDWFLCSTAESWSSCMDLESDCDLCYWAGLPGLITDKNRALIYITDGTKKNYHDIVADKMISRSWLLIMKRGIGKKSSTEITFAKEYPISTGLKEIASKLLNINIFHSEDQFNEPKKYRSRYYFDLLFHKHSNNKKIVTDVYKDTTKVYVKKDNKKKFGKKQGFHKAGRGINLILLNKNGKICNKNHDDTCFYISEVAGVRGLAHLINEKKSITEFLMRN